LPSRPWVSDTTHAMDQRGLAAIGYEHYGNKAGWKNYLGRPMPKWEELPEPIREAWMAASQGIAEAVVLALTEAWEEAARGINDALLTA